MASRAYESRSQLRGCWVHSGGETTVGLTSLVPGDQRQVVILAEHLTEGLKALHAAEGQPFVQVMVDARSPSVEVRNGYDQGRGTHLGVMLNYAKTLWLGEVDMALTMRPKDFYLFILNYNGYPMMSLETGLPSIHVDIPPTAPTILIGGARWAGMSDDVANRAELRVKSNGTDERIILRRDWTVVHRGRAVGR